MPEIRQTLSFLTISNRILERNFTYKVINSMNSLFKVAHITIKKNYFLANQIPVAKGDTISLSLQNNNEDKVTIFSGVIFDISTTNSEIQLKAEFRIVDNTIFNETYQDCTLEYALQKLLPSDKLKYEAQEVKGDQFILDGTKERSLKTQLKNHSYCLDRENCLVVLDNSKRGKKYIIDNCIKDIRGNQITIFPIPLLEINDIVECQGKQYIIRGIVYDFLYRARMNLEVIQYIEPAIAPEQETQEETIPMSKSVKPLFINPDKLDELLPVAIEYFKEIARATKEDMEKRGLTFKSIKINSAWRDTTRQKELLVDMLDLENNMYIVYQKATLSSPYLKIIQNLYDGVSNNDYKAIQRAYDNHPKHSNRNGLERMKLFKKIIDNNPIKQGDKTTVDIILEKSMVENHKIANKDNPNKFWHEPLFNPSFHVFGDENNKVSQALDLDKTDSTEEMYNRHKKNNKSGYEGDTHYHLTYY